jgi:hypothetical protein
MNMIPVRTRGPLFLATLLALALLTPSWLGAAEPPKNQKLTHIGLVWLKKPGDAADRQRIIDALRQFGRDIPEVQALSFGPARPSPSKLVDASFDLCFTMVFDDQAALERYAKHPVHQKAAEEVFLPLSARILFYDFTNQ